MASSVEFQSLLTMQDHDTALDQLRHRRETLPERTKRQELLQQGQRVAAQRDEVVKQRDAIAEREAALEAELSTSETRMKQLDKRLYSGEVSATRDLQAMADEIERLKQYCSKLEDQAIDALNEREPLDEQVASLESQLQGLADEIRALDRVIAASEAEIDTEIDREQAERDGLAAGVPDALLTRYEALRKKHGGAGAAVLNGAQCGGCHLTLPATEVDRIKHEAPDALILCDQCGRILVRR